MSILLEALRKSEKREQRSREVPTIHSEVLSSQPTSPFRLVPIVLLLALTLAVSAWFVWHQYRVPEDAVAETGNGNPGSTGQPVERDSNNAAATAVADGQTSGSSNNDKGLPGDKPLEAGVKRSAEQLADVDESSRGPRSRTPMESYQPDVSDTGNNTTMVNEDAGKRGRSTPERVQIRPVEAPRQASDSPSPGKTAPGGPKDSGSAKPDSRSREPQPIGYWELPDSIRANVPPIKYSVLVYDRNPAARFVLIDGERLTEGDSYQPGLMVKEIRRDGVIFSYRRYQFLVER